MKKIVSIGIISIVFQLTAFAQEFTFKVEGLSCEMCANSATIALKSIEGVQSASVDFDSKTAVMRTNGNVTEHQIKEAIAAKNFAAVFGDDVIVEPLTDEEKGGLNIKVIEGGGKLKFKEHFAVGKITIFDFYADWCGPCKLFSPQLERLLFEDDQLALVMVDVVNWNSPIAKQLTNQYQLPALPFALIFSESGKLLGRIEGNNIEAVKDAIKTK